MPLPLGIGALIGGTGIKAAAAPTVGSILRTVAIEAGIPLAMQAVGSAMGGGLDSADERLRRRSYVNLTGMR